MAAGCSVGDSGPPIPELTERGTTMTTAKLTRQDLTNKVSLDGKVTLNPVFGLTAPIDGQMRYVEVKPQEGTSSKVTRAGAVWAAGKPIHIEVPAGSTFAGRLVDDKAKVTTGMPVVSAKYGGYGIVAEIDSAQAYTLSNGLSAIRAQIKSGPGPFACSVLGTIAALPLGTIPAPAPRQPNPDDPSSAPTAAPEPVDKGQEPQRTPSESTGMRLVCTAPAGVNLINGAAATLEVVTEQATQVLVAPVEAVAGKQGQGKVDVLGPDGVRQTKDVVLGLTDGKVVQIKSGLTGDETLAVPGPNLPPAADRQDGKTGG